MYLEGVLLNAVREDIRENGKLNVHYYDTLKYSVFKPAAFFKGVVFPMCEVCQVLAAPLHKLSCSLERLYFEGGLDCWICNYEDANSDAALRRCSTSHSFYGVLWCDLSRLSEATHVKFGLAIEQVQIRFSYEFFWTRSTLCPIKFLTHSSTISSGSPTPIVG